MAKAKRERVDKFLSKIDKLYELLINKMLFKYKVNYNYVKLHDVIGGESWTNHYTFTPSEFDEFRKWATEQIRHELRLTKSRAVHEFNHFNLRYGLRVEKEINYYPEGEE